MRPITTYLQNGGTLEHAQTIADHESPRTTKLCDRARRTLVRGGGKDQDLKQDMRSSIALSCSASHRLPAIGAAGGAISAALQVRGKLFEFSVAWVRDAAGASTAKFPSESDIS